MCTENSVLIDYVTESPNVSGDDRSVMLLADPVHPITGIAGCCARAASGQATAVPRSVRNSRRLIIRLEAEDKGSVISNQYTGRCRIAAMSALGN